MAVVGGAAAKSMTSMSTRSCLANLLCRARCKNKKVPLLVVLPLLFLLWLVVENGCHFVAWFNTKGAMV